jgi:hypothetical protein
MVKLFQSEEAFFQKPKIMSNWIERIILGVLLVIHVVVLYSVVRSANPLIWPLHNDTIHRSGRASDFYAIYHAALNLEEGISPYQINDDHVTPYFYQFRYLPVVAEAGRVFTRTTPYRAFFLWAMCLELLLGIFIFYIWTRMDHRGYRMAAVALLLLNSPYFLELYMGQFTFATVALCFLALLMPFGFLFYALSIILKPISLAVVPALVRNRNTFVGSIMAGILLLLSNAPIFLANKETWIDFYSLNFAETGGGLHSGNFGLIYFLWQIANDLSLTGLLENWETVFGISRLLLLAAVALLVLYSKVSMRTGVAALLMAHFVSYQHVWEHHHSAVILIGILLLTVPAMREKRLLVLISLIVLALPTPFGLFDVVKDPAVFNPTLSWPRYAVYLTLLPKVVPTVFLFVLLIQQIVKGGFYKTGEVLHHIFDKDAEAVITI